MFHRDAQPRPATRSTSRPPGEQFRRAVRRALVTGGAGFIGSNLADRLLADGAEVVVYDNFSTGQRRFVEAVDASNPAALSPRVTSSTPHDSQTRCVAATRFFHLAANADVRHGLEHPERDLEQNTLAHVSRARCDASRPASVASCLLQRVRCTANLSVFPTPEDCPFPRQTSLYAASKLAGEGLVQAFCEGYGFSGVILRFVSIMGERYTHGHLFDFYRSLLADPCTSAHPRRRSSAQVVPLHRGLHRRHTPARLPSR